MKKLLIILAVGLATTSVKAQAVAVLGDTLKTNSQWVKTKAVLPKDVSDVMTISRDNDNKTLVVEFDKHLTQEQLELVKNYVRYYYDWGLPSEQGYDANGPDVYNEKKSCQLIFYKRG